LAIVLSALLRLAASDNAIGIYIRRAIPVTKIMRKSTKSFQLRSVVYLK